MRDIEFDPLTGVKTTIDYSDDMKVTVNQSQDISAACDYAAQRRRFDKPLTDRWHHYAIIPTIVMHEMYQKGIDPCREPKACFEYINTNYPALKLTERWHDDKRAKVKDTHIVVK